MDQFIAELQALLAKHQVKMTGEAKQPTNFEIFGVIHISVPLVFGSSRMFRRITPTETDEYKR